MTKQIPLSQGKFVIVDDKDYEFLSQWKWCFNGRYAMRNKYLGWKNRKSILKTIYMHRLILNPPDGFYTDHINGDKLDNRRSNLRICTNQQNQFNQTPTQGGSSKYKGVTWHKRDEMWMSSIRLNNKTKFLGYFDSEEDAAQAYNFAAIEHHGEFANLNKAV